MEKRIEGKDVLLIQPLAGEHDYNVKETSPMFGKKFKRYSFGGLVFISNDDEFQAQVKKGGLDTVTLEVNTDGERPLASLTGFITTKQLVGFNRGRKALAAIEAIEVTSKAISEEELNALMA